MDVDEILGMLPEEAPEGLARTVLHERRGRLGGDLLIFSRESWYPDDGGIGWPDFEPDYTPHWCARCTCTACGEDFRTAWLTGGGVVLVVGPDGQIMTADELFAGDACLGEVVEIQCAQGDETNCPFCGTSVILTRRSSLKYGRTFQIMAGCVETLGEYAAVVFYLVSRRFEADGNVDVDAAPMYAAVIDRDGRLRLFSHARPGMFGKVLPGDTWSSQCSARDPFQRRYYDWGSVNHTFVGGIMRQRVPDLGGTTGEKTGLAEYVAGGGGWPVLYLRFWKKHRSVENLIKAGWVKSVDGCIEDEVERAFANGVGQVRCPRELEALADWTQVRPHAMLGMDREAVRKYRVWTHGDLALFHGMTERCGLPPGDADAFAGHYRVYGTAALERFLRWVREADVFFDFPRLDRYLARQGERTSAGLGLFMDYRNMLAEWHWADNGALTEAELWPRHLRAAHDRLADAQKVEDSPGMCASFAAIAEKWAALEWSDGQICAVLPKANQELVREGKVLHHCVGGYGKSHIKGQIIVFIRHARRPERSWFTLNIDLTGREPREIQLHGFGNEWVRGKRLRIPPQVRNFCDRWEKEVLVPVFHDVKKQEKRQKRICTQA